MKALRFTGLASVMAACGVLFAACSRQITPPDPSGTSGPILVSSNVSWLTVPVEIKLRNVAAVVNLDAPTHLQGTYNITQNVPHLHFHGIRQRPTTTWDPAIIAHIDYRADRGEIKLAGSGDRISVQVPLSAGGKLIPSAATIDVAGTVGGATTLIVLPDYNLAPSVDLNVTIDRAAVLHGISIRDLVQGAVNDAINKIKGNIGADIGKAVNLRKLAEIAWGDIPGCVLVPKTTDIWVRLSLEKIMLAGPRVDNDKVTAGLTLQAKVETLFQSSQPSPPQKVPLPNLAGAPPIKSFTLPSR